MMKPHFKGKSCSYNYSTKPPYTLGCFSCIVKYSVCGELEETLPKVWLAVLWVSKVYRLHFSCGIMEFLCPRNTIVDVQYPHTIEKFNTSTTITCTLNNYIMSPIEQVHNNIVDKVLLSTTTFFTVDHF